MSGAQGLETRACNADDRAGGALGSVLTLTGIGAGPLGFPAELAENSILFCGAFLTFEFTVSRTPPSIQERIMLSCLLLSFSPSGGMKGSMLCDEVRNSRESAPSPAVTAAPPEPPAMVPR